MTEPVAAPGRRYLVGGAVRDALLGLPVGEKDWVVVGSTADAMIERGFRQVGADFPVFLHPQTQEEYALARTERKSGHGYHGFSVEFGPDVTLEQDLERRDLTINAIAEDDDGALIDPFGGRDDLDERWLRHVSAAFSEDPLRVLRVARFAARFEPLGFRVHPETQALMTDMVAAGELAHLTPERVWQETWRAMAAARPSAYVRILRDCGALKAWFPEVDALFGVPQDARYHPEVDTGEHLLLCLDQAAGAEPEAVFAVLVHDLGKGATPRSEWPSHHGHEQRGVPLVDALCDRLKAPNVARRLGKVVCAEHLRCHRALELRPAKVLDLLERVGAIQHPDRLPPFVAACRADWRGRPGREDDPYPQADRLTAALAAVRGIQARDLDLEGLEGPAVGERLREARIDAIRALGTG